MKSDLKPGDSVLVEWLGELDPSQPWRTRHVPVLAVRGDYAFLLVSYPVGDGRQALVRRAFHIRTGKPRRDHGRGWRLSQKHCDPRAGRGTTR